MMALLGFDFQRVHLWPLFGVVVTLFLLGLFVLTLRRGARAKLADNHLLQKIGANFSANRARLRIGLEAAAAGLVVLALLGPVRGHTEVPALRKGLDIVVCIDTSKSMLARDLSPNRLQRARREVRGLVEQLSGDRVALIAFAGDAREVAPLTRDRNALLSFLDGVSPDDNRLGGTSIGAALERALGFFDGRTGAHEAIVLLTDGEDLEGEGLAVAKRAAEQNIGIYVVGMGTEQGGKIPMVGRNGSESFLRGPDGAEVVTRLDRNSLADLAAVSGGAFLTTSDSPTPLEEIYEKRIGQLDRRSLGGAGQRIPHDRYQWALVPGVALALLALGLRERRPRWSMARANRAASLMALPLLTLGFAAGIGAPPAQAQQPGGLTPIQSPVVDRTAIPAEDIALPPPFDDQNPQAAMVLTQVVESCEEGDFGTALHWLNYSLEDLEPQLRNAGEDLLAKADGDEALDGEPPVQEGEQADAPEPGESKDEEPMGPRFAWTDFERAHLTYALGMVHSRMGGHSLAAEEFFLAAALAEEGDLRRDALFNRATTRLFSMEQRLDELLEELGGEGAPAMPPMPGAPAADEQSLEEKLEALHRGYLRVRGDYLDLLAVESDCEDGQANLEYVIQRLRELDAMIEQQQEQEDEQESEESEGEEGEEGEEDNEDNEDNEGAEEEEGEEGEDDSEEEEPLNEREEEQEEEPAPSEQEQEQGESEEQPEAVAPKELSKEQMARLLDRLGELEKEQAEIKSRLQKTRQVPVERDW